MAKFRTCVDCGGKAIGRNRCNPCRNLRYKTNQPIRYGYFKLKFRAKERGHEFNLSLDEYTQLYRQGYGAAKGRTVKSLQLDRIDPSRGYEIGNLRVVTSEFNGRRMFVPYFQNLRRSPTADEVAEVERELARQLSDPLETL